ncbi:uncharacterized protein LOC129953692 [Eupeodes corollae]|uniref:uncharacterized protein LOC129953692 n=1 Tax=Eupeodes corollae TaxID=290404 RepID=UPI00248FFDC9|nr:uncharacterized protein LOC129953692 [Eupeodes corollae]
MDKKRDLLLGLQSNSNLTNVTFKEQYLNDKGSDSSTEPDVLRRSNSLPIIISTEMICGWKKKNTHSDHKKCITKESNRQSLHLIDTSSSSKFDFFKNETGTKSLQDLQIDVDALIEFRNVVIEKFPDLKSKMMSMGAAVLSKKNQFKKKKIRKKTGTSINAQKNLFIYPVEVIDEAVPSFFSRSRSNSNCCKKEPKSGEGSGSTVQDSGFSTETTSSKEGCSTFTSSTGLQVVNASNRLFCDSDDELLNLLDVIFRKTLKFRKKCPSMSNFECDKNERHTTLGCSPNFRTSNILHPKILRFNKNHPFKQNLLRLNIERDMILLNVAELESEVIKNRIKISKMETKLALLSSEKKNLEEELKAALNRNKELNFEFFQRNCDITSRKDVRPKPVDDIRCQPEIHVKHQCLHLLNKNYGKGTDQTRSKKIRQNIPSENGRRLQSSTCGNIFSEVNNNSENLVIAKKKGTILYNEEFVYNSGKSDNQHLGKLDGVLSSPKCLFKAREIDSDKVAAILLEKNPIELQRHLLTLTVENQARRSYPEHNDRKTIPSVIKKNASKHLMQQIENISDYKHDYDNNCSVEYLNNFEHLFYENVEAINRDKNIGGILAHDQKIYNACKKNSQVTNRVKPSRIPLFDSKTLHSTKESQKSLSLSKGNILTQNSHLNQQDSLTFKNRVSLTHVNTSPKKKNQDPKTKQIFHLKTPPKSKLNFTSNEYIQTDKTAEFTKKLIQNKHSDPLITFPIRTDREKRLKFIFDSNEKLVRKRDTKTKMDTEQNKGYLKQSGVNMLIGGVIKSSYKNSITNSSINNSIGENEPLTDDHIGTVSNFRSALFGWLKI